MDAPSTTSPGSSSPLSELSFSPSPPPPGFLFDCPSTGSSSELSSLHSTPSPEHHHVNNATMASMHTPPSTQSEDDSSSALLTPPKKRRRLNADRERNPAYLNLLGHEVKEDEREQLAKLLKVLHKRRKIVVVAGAGISVSAGIPDFRSSTGLFKTLKREHNLKSSGKDLFDASVYKDGNSTTSFHAMIRNLATATKDAQPTPFHHLLATLAQEGRLLRLYSQNVDGIDTSLKPLETQVPLPKKAPWPKTIQLHGTLEHMTCTKCHRISEFKPELFEGPSPPPCGNCEETDGIRTQHAGKRSHGIGVLRPRMVLYNEHNPDDEAIGSVVKADLRTRPDALIVVGTTLKVPGVRRIVKEMCGIVRDRKDGVTIWINNDPPPALKDYEWDLIVQGPCDLVAAHAALRRWDQPEPELQLVSEDHVEKLKRDNGMPEVVIVSPERKSVKDSVESLQGVITPAPSPKPQRTNAGQPADGAKATNKKQATLMGPKRKAGDTKKATTKKTPATKKTSAKSKNGSRQPTEKKSTGPNAKISFTLKKPHLSSIPIKPDVKQQSLSPSENGAERKEVFAIIPEPVIDVMQPLSPSSARNNGSPPYSAPLITLPQKQPTCKGSRKAYGAELSVDTSLRTPIKAKESPEERKRTITPPGNGPRGMHDLIQW
ncbi:uncharacterized protein PV09_02335 [Verruconis gallopava]|uniref:Deacetylase sirtuin-type domain-containing protein n=1 Tax=Verruconis gallopava TaxID=253628 RepID=A0A0D2AIC6_9PEZI|nr:uncharacterized protein PV09_02335 [Verruconis gallopava]KIW06623.1 hypothetical protein PV09_02335 [Verruconis gallopava]